MIRFYIEPDYDVRSPEREYGNAGIDFFIPQMTSAFRNAFLAKNGGMFKKDEKQKWNICIPAHGRVNIPSGVRSRISPNIALEAQNKSGIATKLGLVYGASVIDASYMGVIHLSVINTTDKEVMLPLGAKLVQFIPRLIDTSEIEVVTSGSLDEFYADFEFSNRGEGAFGSTGV